MEESQAAQAAKMTEVGSMEVPKTMSLIVSRICGGDRVLADCPGRRGEEGGGRAGSTGGLNRQGLGGGGGTPKRQLLVGIYLLCTCFALGRFWGWGPPDRQADGRLQTRKEAGNRENKTKERKKVRLSKACRRDRRKEHPIRVRL